MRRGGPARKAQSLAQVHVSGCRRLPRQRGLCFRPGAPCCDEFALGRGKSLLGIEQFEQRGFAGAVGQLREPRSEEHTSELQSLMRISYAVFCLKTKQNKPFALLQTLYRK